MFDSFVLSVVIVCLGIDSALLFSAPPDASMPGELKMTHKSATVADVIFSLELPQRGRLSQAVPLRVTIENGRKSDLQFAAGRLPICASFLTNTTARKAIAIKPESLGLLGGSLTFGSGSFETLMPGEKKTWIIDLRECYDLSPAQYDLRVELRSPVKASIGDVHFECVK